MSLKNPIALECTWEFPIRNHFLPLQALKYPLLSWMQLNLSFLSGRTMLCTRWSLQITQDKRKSIALLLFSSERKTSSGRLQHLQWNWSPLLLDLTCISLTHITWILWWCCPESICSSLTIKASGVYAHGTELWRAEEYFLFDFRLQKLLI